MQTPEQEMALRNRILFTEVGSHMYGTNTPESDHDYVGIFIPDKEYILGLKRCDQVEIKTNPSSSGKRNSKDDVDCTIYSLPKFLHLAAGCNPNIIEILFSPNPFIGIEGRNLMYGQGLVGWRKMFLTQRARDTFLGYAHSQREKLLVKKDRLDAIRKAKEDLVGIGVTKGIHQEDAIVNRLVVKGSSGNVYRIFESRTALDHVFKTLDEMEQEYGLRTKSVEQFGYDTKFAMHLIRLLFEGIDILEGKELTFPLKRDDVNELMQIRRGEWSIESVIAVADRLMKRAETMESSIPKNVDVDILSKIQMRLIEGFWETREKDKLNVADQHPA